MLFDIPIYVCSGIWLPELYNIWHFISILNISWTGQYVVSVLQFAHRMLLKWYHYHAWWRHVIETFPPLLTLRKGHWYNTSGARFIKAFDVIIWSYHKSHTQIKVIEMHILRCVGSEFCLKFRRYPLKFHTKFERIHAKLWSLWSVTTLTNYYIELWHLKSQWNTFSNANQYEVSFG